MVGLRNVPRPCSVGYNGGNSAFKDSIKGSLYRQIFSTHFGTVHYANQEFPTSFWYGSQRGNCLDISSPFSVKAVER